MNEHCTHIVNLLRSGKDPEYLTGLVRSVMKTNPDDLAQVAQLIYSRGYYSRRHNDLDKLRVVISRICKELKLPRLTVRIENGRYAVCRVNRRSSDEDSVCFAVVAAAEKARCLSVEERHWLLQKVAAALGISQR